jgi:hypothetical protein
MTNGNVSVIYTPARNTCYERSVIPNFHPSFRGLNFRYVCFGGKLNFLIAFTECRVFEVQNFTKTVSCLYVFCCVFSEENFPTWSEMLN